MRIKDLATIIQRLAPPDLAFDWDNPGLQVGSLKQEISRIGLALDATDKTLDAAIRAGCDLLFTHHPLIFKAIKKIDPDTYPGTVIARAISAGLAIFSAHTNWDSASQGVAQALADRLGLEGREPLEAISRDFLKLVVFVPAGYEKPLRDALFEAGGGVIGDYDHCWFGARGEGGYRVPPGASPFIGEAGREARARESRLEVILPAALADQAAAAVRKNHPYEEPAFEFHAVKVPGPNEGLGLLGLWPEERNLLSELDKAGFKAYKWAGPAPQRVRRVALLPGSGGDYIYLAKARGADVLITGDVKYNQALDSESLGISLVDLGHYETEWPGVEQLADLLNKELSALYPEVECLLLEQGGPWHYQSESIKP